MMDDDSNSIDSDGSDIEWVDGVGENDELDGDTFTKVKANDPSTTSLRVMFGSHDDRSFLANNIDWEKEFNAFADNTHLEHVYLSGSGDWHEIDEDEQNPNISPFCKAMARSRSVKMMHIHGLFWKMCSPLSPLFGRLTNLSLENCWLKMENAQLLTAPLSKAVSLEQLSLKACNISDDTAPILLNALGKHCAIVKLSLEDNRIGVNGCNALSELLQNPKCKLEDLDISNNCIGDEGGDIITKAVAKNTTLKILTMRMGLLLRRNDRISYSGWQVMFDNLRNTNHLALEELNVAHLPLGINDAVVSLANLVANASSMKSLSFPCLSLGRIDHEQPSKGVATWETFFRHTCRNLTTLKMRRARIGYGMGILAHCVQSNDTKLKVLDLRSLFDHVPPSHFQSLLSALGNSYSVLEELDISNNPGKITDETLALLGNAIANNTTLKVLGLASTLNVTPEGWRDFFTSMQGSNCIIEELKLQDNTLDDEGAIALANMITTNAATLKVLYLGNNGGTTSLGWTAIADKLCNTASVLDTYHSNHTLQWPRKKDEYERYPYEDDVGYIPRRLKSLLRMNRNTNKNEVARHKILRYHMLVDGATKVEEFVDMESKVIPFAISWIGRDNKGHSLLYRLLQCLPIILGYHGMKGNTTGAKRKREE